MMIHARLRTTLSALTLCSLAGLVLADQTSGERPTCLYVSSYHVGYAWSDGVERGLRGELGDACELHQFDMDTKRKKSLPERQAAGDAAWDLIRKMKPDVVITSDDNAAKYLIEPYLMDHPTPVVFMGINFTVEEYGLPVSNVTGIVEVAPIKPMLEEGIRLLGSAKRVAYVGAQTLTEEKNHERMQDAGDGLGLTVDKLLADSLEGWKEAFLKAQDYDFVLIGSSSGIGDWNEDDAREFAEANTRRLSLTNHDWMMGEASIGFTKIPEEHGEWAAAATKAILDGTPPNHIPLVTNRKWDVWLNMALFERTRVPMDNQVLAKAKRVRLP